MQISTALICSLSCTYECMMKATTKKAHANIDTLNISTASPSIISGKRTINLLLVNEDKLTQRTCAHTSQSKYNR